MIVAAVIWAAVLYAHWLCAHVVLVAPKKDAKVTLQAAFNLQQQQQQQQLCNQIDKRKTRISFKIYHQLLLYLATKAPKQ